MSPSIYQLAIQKLGGQMQKLLDTSIYQGQMDWRKAKDNGIEGAIIKACQAGRYSGEMFTDNQFHNSWVSARQAGLKVGAYLFYMSNCPPKVQAKYFFDLVGVIEPGQILPVLDVEKWGIPPEKRATEASKILECLLEIENLCGERPMIYTNWSTWKELGNPSWGAAYQLWLARYPLVSDGLGGYRKLSSFDEMETWTPQASNIPAPWTSYAVWQGTDKGDGLLYGAKSKGLDLNLCPDLRNILTEEVDPTPEPEPEPPITDFQEVVLDFLASIDQGVSRVGDLVEAGPAPTPTPEPTPTPTPEPSEYFTVTAKKDYPDDDGIRNTFVIRDVNDMNFPLMEIGEPRWKIFRGAQVNVFRSAKDAPGHAGWKAKDGAKNPLFNGPFVTADGGARYLVVHPSTKDNPPKGKYYYLRENDFVL